MVKGRSVKKKERFFSDQDLDPVKRELAASGYDGKLDYIGGGNWGEVYKVRHSRLKCDRAVKILLPAHLKKTEVKTRFLGEAQKMVEISHHRIVNIFDFGNPRDIPYYVMEYVESEGLKPFLENNKTLTRKDYLDILNQICEALIIIHTKIVHLDIKSENILVSKDLTGVNVKVADFGLAHYRIGTPTPKYIITADISWMPESLIEFRGKSLSRFQFKPSHDLAYLGRMLDTLPYEKYISNHFSDRQILLLRRIIKDLLSESFQNADELAEQLKKLSPTHPPTGGIPELASAMSIDNTTVIRVPRQTIVPTTKRLLKLIRLPELQRLRNVKQLGPTSLIYPGATHTRFEHSLGAYALAVKYLVNLLKDPAFDYLFNSEQLTNLLVAVLLHDIGHYPYAHLLEELRDSRFPSHSKNSCDLICGRTSLPDRYEKSPGIVDILSSEFNTDPKSIAKIIEPSYFKETLSLQDQILASFLDGALDVDKQDYLVRDSLHVGVEYARHIDQARLLRSLTISKQKNELAVTEKGKSAIEFLIMSRSAMFSEVYWHHTNRAATAMIQRAFREALNEPPKIKKSELLPILMSSSDQGILRFLHDRGPDHIIDLIPDRNKWSIRQVYKRVVTFAMYYEGVKSRIYDKLVTMSPKEINKIEGKIISFLNKTNPGLKIKPHEILLDVPIGEEKIPPIQIVFPSEDTEISLKDITHFDSSIFDQFFRFTKKARVFCHPRLKATLREKQNEIREQIANEIGVPFPLNRA